MMQITITLNGTKISPEIEPDTLLIDLVRSQGCYSVKRGCETANCGLCTVFLDEKPVLSCSVLAARADGAGWTVDDTPFDRVVLACSASEAARLTRDIAPAWSASAA